jgi:prepilin-type N-terminal cleavage/methylation domain-containing protein
MKPTRNHASLPGALAGFTLVELLVVIAIIGVLAGITYPAVESIIQRAKKNSTRALINGIDSGLEMFKSEFGHVPYNDDDGRGDVPVVPEGRQEYVRLWLLGLDKAGEPDGNYSNMSSEDVRAHPLWHGEYVEIKKDKHLDPEYDDCNYCFVDAWGNPLFFEFYDAEERSGDQYRNKPIFNISKWDIWSKGPDEKGTEDMRDIQGSSYEKRRENWLEEDDDPDFDGKECNRDNPGNW